MMDGERLRTLADRPDYSGASQDDDDAGAIYSVQPRSSATPHPRPTPPSVMKRSLRFSPAAAVAPVAPMFSSSPIRDCSSDEDDENVVRMRSSRALAVTSDEEDREYDNADVLSDVSSLVLHDETANDAYAFACAAGLCVQRRGRIEDIQSQRSESSSVSLLEDKASMATWLTTTPTSNTWDDSKEEKDTGVAGRKSQTTAQVVNQLHWQLSLPPSNQMFSPRCATDFDTGMSTPSKLYKSKEQGNDDTTLEQRLSRSRDAIDDLLGTSTTTTTATTTTTTTTATAGKNQAEQRPGINDPESLYHTPERYVVKNSARKKWEEDKMQQQEKLQPASSSNSTETSVIDWIKSLFTQCTGGDTCHFGRSSQNNNTCHSSMEVPGRIETTSSEKLGLIAPPPIMRRPSSKEIQQVR